MGTFFTNGATQQDIVDQLLEPLKREGVLLESAVMVENGQSILWTVEKMVRDGEPYQYIGCYLLVENSHGWGYKAMDESAGPCYYSVPVDWLKYPFIMPNGDSWRSYSVEWRDKICRGRNNPLRGGLSSRINHFPAKK